MRPCYLSLDSQVFLLPCSVTPILFPQGLICRGVACTGSFWRTPTKEQRVLMPCSWYALIVPVAPQACSSLWPQTNVTSRLCSTVLICYGDSGLHVACLPAITLRLGQSSSNPWAARCCTGLLTILTPKGVVFSFLCFSFQHFQQGLRHWRIDAGRGGAGSHGAAALHG